MPSRHIRPYPEQEHDQCPHRRYGKPNHQNVKRQKQYSKHSADRIRPRKPPKHLIHPNPDKRQMQSRDRQYMPNPICLIELPDFFIHLPFLPKEHRRQRIPVFFAKFRAQTFLPSLPEFIQLILYLFILCRRLPSLTLHRRCPHPPVDPLSLVIQF